MDKINGKVTGPAVLAIVVIMVFQTVLPFIAPGDNNTDMAMIAFRERVTIEHAAQSTALKELAVEMRLLSNANRELLILLRDIKNDNRYGGTP